MGEGNWGEEKGGKSYIGLIFFGVLVLVTALL
jgi:hypothetical protein